MQQIEYRDKRIFQLICFIIAFGMTLSVYPFIGLADGFHRWKLALEIIDNGKIVSESLMSPVLPYFKAFTYLLTNNYGLFTFIQCILFYLSIGFLVKDCLKDRFIVVGKFKIGLWLLVSIILLLIPTVNVFPAMLTDSAPVFVILVSFFIVAQSKLTSWLKFAIELILTALCIGIRINSFVLFGMLVFGLLWELLMKKKKTLIITLGAIFLGTIIGLVLLPKLNPSSFNSSTLGMVWELTEITAENDNEYLYQQLKEYGDIDEAIQRIGDPYLNALVWDNNPPFSAYSIAGEYSKDIAKLYIYTAIQYPKQFFMCKLDFMFKSLGCTSKLISSSRGIHGVDKLSQTYGGVPTKIQDDIRRAYIYFTDDLISFIALRPITLITISLIFNILLTIGKRKRYWLLSVIGIGYYSSFLINTQAYEFRYWAPSFYILLICVICEVVELIYWVSGSTLYKNNKKKIIIELIIFMILISGISILSKRIIYNSMNIYTANLSDENWNNGILISNKAEILFENTSVNRYKLEKAEYIICNGQEYEILNYSCTSNWIRICLDRDAQDCAYPTPLSSK